MKRQTTPHSGYTPTASGGHSLVPKKVSNQKVGCGPLCVAVRVAADFPFPLLQTPQGITDLKAAGQPPKQLNANQMAFLGMEMISECDTNTPWNKEQDEVLREGVLRYGPTSWDQISAHLGSYNRSAPSCQQRWDIVKAGVVKVSSCRCSSEGQRVRRPCTGD